MEILNDKQIKERIERLAIHILENNYNLKQLILIGINKNGLVLAERILKEIQLHSKIDLQLVELNINAKAPLDQKIQMSIPVEKLNGECLIMIDDVANTGRTLHYAMKPLLDVLPQKVEVAVLVNRAHKLFPIHADYVGLTLATTVEEHIEVILDEKVQLY